ncbi:hypothetical protein K6119_12655 [Paracrocinitomix mangrovi]|uniref:hypothetical protein n=1 Tax=Paracrocinitomix mangrovi TaxID=2862509 RepID=UPI001C8DD770|nr:hypothetical protein [Paracrocinitomix mangrovi]UKN00581.1 hypothetical protein K6119_12655 [Paracrocinitomix mangrovi]
MKHYLLILFFLISGVQAVAQKNQNHYAEKFTSGQYSVYKVVEKSYGKYVFEEVKKKWPIEVTASSGKIDQVLVKRAGIIDEIYKPDIPTFPAYFGFQDLRVTYIDGLLYYYKWTSKNAADIKYIMSTSKIVSGKLDPYKVELEEYVKNIVKNQSGAKEEIKEQKQQLAEEERLANSLQNKKPKSIKGQWVKTPDNLGLGSLLTYGVVATLEDGTVLKTPNLGGKLPWSDFKIEAEGSTNTEEEIMVLEDGSLIPNDKVILKIQSVYHPTIKTTLSKDLTYNKDLEINYPGGYGKSGSGVGLACSDCGRDGGDGGGGYKGKSLNINVQEFTNTGTGVTYNKVEIIDAYSGKTLHKFKISPFSTLIINNPGGSGGSGGNGGANGSASADGGNGGDGGDGGDITITLNSGTNLMYRDNNHGGRGGGSGSGDGSLGKRGQNGSAGYKGTTTESTGFVNINW